MSAPPLGLLLDVDGPIASPHTRTVSAPGLLESLTALLAAGVPIALNTGRSVAFVRQRVLGPLTGLGLPDGTRLHAVCEKGGVWTSVSAAGAGAVSVDERLAVPISVGEAVATLARRRYSDAMFVDTTKQTMATVEARTDVTPEAFARAQAAFDAELVTGLTAAGLGVVVGDEARPDAAGRTPWRIEPTVIATDVQSVVAGKDLGARRALELVAGDGPLPRAWETVGDSPGDYAMADQLHALDHAVTHVDVGPRAPRRDRPYPVRTVPGLHDDAAGAAHLHRLVAHLVGR